MPVSETPISSATGWSGVWRPEVPRRLTDATRELARRAQSGEHGRTMRNADFVLNEASVTGMSPDLRYAHAAMLVAREAPLRILPGEKIVGSATLLEAAAHMTPVAGVHSTSHTTLGFHRVLKTGYRGLRQQIEERLARGGFEPYAPEKPEESPARGEEFLQALLVCLDAAQVWRQRHLALLDKLAANADGAERAGYLQVRRCLEKVPENPPETFREAVQSLWFMYAFQRLMGNWSGVGRVDAMLGPYLQRDLEAGLIDLDEARDLIAHFWIKGCEWIGAFDTPGSGDAQHYQNVILGGVDEAGNEVTNEVTYLVLDVVEELQISDFPIAVRVNSRTPSRLLRRIAEVQRHGGGIVAIYNEDVVLEGLVKFGYSPEEARGYTNDGCWEVIMPGRTCFGYAPFDMLGILQDALGLRGETAQTPDFDDFEALYAAFLRGLRAHIDAFNSGADHHAASGHPAPLISLMVEDCIERARGYFDRGARYNVLSPHAGGMPDTANSLLAIRRIVFEDETLSLPELVRVLRTDWAGQEHLRRMVANRLAYYGNDDPDADSMMRRVFDDYTAMVWELPERNGVKRPAGISTFGREIAWAPSRCACPDGHQAGAILATNCSPSPGTDREGPTCAVKSFCKLDFTRTPNGATLELKLHPTTVQGEDGLNAMVSLLRTFVELGGFYLQVDVVDSAMLIDAQQHPEKYPNLSVRISGWSARFATLSKEWQDMIIQRTQQYFGG